MKKGQVIFKNNLTYKAPLVGSRSNRFWKELEKFREWKSHSRWVATQNIPFYTFEYYLSKIT